jgi:AcrR family transcriptional regulator
MSTRDIILDAAEGIFVSRGFSGSSMKTIAEKAHVSKSLLYHYFLSKRELWEAVVHRRVLQADLPERMIETVSAVVSDGIDAIRDGRKHTTYFEFLRDNPQFVRMLAWLNAEQAFPMDPPVEMRREVIAKLSELQRNGIFRNDIDPRMFVVCFMAICEMWFVARNRISAWLGDDMNDEKMSEVFIDAAGKILLDGMVESE